MVSHDCSYDIVTAIFLNSLIHNPVEASFGNQVLHTDFDSRHAILLGNDADIGCAHAILLGGFLCRVIAVIIDEVDTT